MHEQLSVKIGNLTVSMSVADIVKEALRQACSDPVSVAPSALTVPAIGERWTGQGGYYAGIIRGRDGRPGGHLIIAPPDSDGIDLAWGELGKEVAGASSPWDGQTNTQALIKSGGKHPAAKHASAFSCEGHSDYHLGSHAEMGIAWANVPELFESTWYWTSSQSSALYAWIQYFDGGSQYYTGKGYEGRVRPVRLIPIQ